MKIYTCMASIKLQMQDVKKLMSPLVEGIGRTYFSCTASDTSITTQSRNKQILFSAMITLKIKSLCTLLQSYTEHGYRRDSRGSDLSMAILVTYNSTLVVFFKCLL